MESWKLSERKRQSAHNDQNVLVFGMRCQFNQLATWRRPVMIFAQIIGSDQFFNNNIGLQKTK